MHFTNRRESVAAVLWCLLTACFGNLIAMPGYAQAANAVGVQASIDSLPVKISPEGAQALTGAGEPFIFVNADDQNDRQVYPVGPVRLIYYTTGPSSRAAERLVAQDRKARAAASPEINFSSQRLTGTPLDWQRLALKFNQITLPARPLELTPKQLSEAIKDGVDLQIVDLRPTSPGTVPSPFPEALSLLPHQLDNDPAKLSKQRWIVLIDGGNRAAHPLAERLFQQGYLLTTILAGGYPAWVEATDR